MSNQNSVARWLLSSADDRQHSRELRSVYGRFELAEVEVAGLGHVTQRAMYEAMQINLLRAEADRLAPDGAEIYALIAVAGASEMANVIARVNRPGFRP